MMKTNILSWESNDKEPLSVKLCVWFFTIFDWSDLYKQWV